MIHITIASVGKLKEKYLIDGVAEYSKRLGRYCRLSFLEVADEKTPDGASPAQEEQIRRIEGQRLLELLPNDAYRIALTLDGRKQDSPAMARRMEQIAVQGAGHLVFLIGGSLGLSEEVISSCADKWSFSDLTFPHQLMRLILLEQIYRCFRINRNEPYHK